MQKVSGLSWKERRIRFLGFRHFCGNRNPLWLELISFILPLWILKAIPISQSLKARKARSIPLLPLMPQHAKHVFKICLHPATGVIVMPLPIARTAALVSQSQNTFHTIGRKRQWPLSRCVNNVCQNTKTLWTDVFMLNPMPVRFVGHNYGLKT